MNREENLCRSLYNGPDAAKPCPYEKCKYVHDLDNYFAEKPEDVGLTCPVYSTRGFCPRGLTCRFAKNHLDENRNNRKEEWYDEAKANDTINYLASGIEKIQF